MSTTPSSDENDGSSTEPPSSSQANNDDGDGLWGLTTALGSATSWGLGTLAAAATVATEPEEVQEEEDEKAETEQLSAASDKKEEKEDDDEEEKGEETVAGPDEYLAEIESTIAAAETAISTGFWSTVAAVSNTLQNLDDAAATTAAETTKASDSNAPLSDKELAAMTGEVFEEEEEQEEATEQKTTAASVLETGSEAVSSLINLYNSKVNQAAEWIDELERDNAEQDPYKRLREHLDEYVAANPRGTYEEWIKLWVNEEGWEAVVDNSYYAEESVHRNLWNEKNYKDGILVEDEDPQRPYIPAPTTNAQTSSDRIPVQSFSPKDGEEIVDFETLDDTNANAELFALEDPPSALEGEQDAQ